MQVEKVGFFLICHSKPDGSEKQKSTRIWLVNFSHKTTRTTLTNPNMYVVALLKDIHLDFHKEMIWEALVKMCHLLVCQVWWPLPPDGAFLACKRRQ
jgi:hypothetical protein